MIPVPDHLEKILVVDTAQSDDYNVNGSVKCHCGCDLFTLRVFAGNSNGSLCVERWEDSFALMIAACCDKCGSEWIIFDAARHCYDGLVCGDYVSPSESALTPYRCTDCGKDLFRLELSLEMEDQEQFIEEVVELQPDSFSASDYVNALNWITIGLHCADCGHDDPEWISLEGC